MSVSAITDHLDFAQLLVAAFFIFFIGLILHLRAEDKREGYPLRDPAGGPDQVGFPELPKAKVFVLQDGGQVTAPHPDPQRDLAARRLHPDPGSPLVPTGDPLADGVGPAAWALRKEAPMFFQPGVVQVAPLRRLAGYAILPGDPDPRGMTVIGSDGGAVGVVEDVWIDRGVKIVRYLEVALDSGAPDQGDKGGGRALVPIYDCDIKARRRRVRVSAVPAARFADAPRLRDPHQITAREEDRVSAFFAGAQFYVAPAAGVPA
jgi:photosynthetic reaction center H subunit